MILLFMVFQFLNAFSLLLSHHDGYCQRACIDSPSLIHTCDCSVTHFGKGASPVLDFLLRLPPVVILAMIETGCSSDDSHLETHVRFGRLVSSCLLSVCLLLIELSIHKCMCACCMILSSSCSPSAD